MKKARREYIFFNPTKNNNAIFPFYFFCLFFSQAFVEIECFIIIVHERKELTLVRKLRFQRYFAVVFQPAFLAKSILMIPGLLIVRSFFRWQWMAFYKPQKGISQTNQEILFNRMLLHEEKEKNKQTNAKIAINSQQMDLNMAQTFQAQHALDFAYKTICKGVNCECNPFNGLLCLIRFFFFRIAYSMILLFVAL